MNSLPPPNKPTAEHWKFQVGDLVVPTKSAGILSAERRIIQRLQDVDTKQRYYRFVPGKSGTALDSATLMESKFEVINVKPAQGVSR